MSRGLVLGLVAALAAGPAQALCGNAAEACRIATGQYHLALPDASDEPGAGAPPLVVFLHGAGNSGGNVIANGRLVGGLLSRGYAVLAPDGSRKIGKGRGLNWNFFPGWEGRDETEFLRQVVSDATARFGTGSDRVLLAGFSAGGFMVNYLACAAPDTFSAYAPVAGGFWRPHPETCDGPVRLFHTHGWSDRTVPIEGRFLGGGRFQQGDIFTGLEIWRDANGCTDQRPDASGQSGPFLRREWRDCMPGSALELAMFPGGHKVPQGWSDMVLDWFEALEED